MRVLYIARNFPNPILPRLGIWTERMLRVCQPACQFKVISPVPYAPPLPGLTDYARFRKIERSRWDRAVQIFHPRFLTAPGHWLHGLQACAQYPTAVRVADRIRRDFRFELIHAHMTFPDGVVAVRLGQRYGVPVVVSEHVMWRPWMDNYSRVRRQAIWAARRCAFHLPVSVAARNSIVHFSGESEKLRVMPNVVDGATFTLAVNGARPVENRLLFVGIMRQVKGVDVLLKAVRLLADRGRNVQLAIIGESFYEGYRRDEVMFRRLTSELRLDDRVAYLGGKEPAEVAKEIQRSALVVLPSRRESFGTVLVEALACGIPVVATSCGGTEDIVNGQVGLLVPPEDPQALADGIEQVLDRRDAYDPQQLRAYALENFGSAVIGRRIVDLYREAVESFRQP
jgi:glycosyltransferase involved in cell wall biosynthesis